MKFAIDYMFKISSLGAGVGFGELALINSKPRSATIVTEEDTWWAILLKVPFEAILQKFERDKITAMISILDRFLLFKTYTRITKTYLLKGKCTFAFIKTWLA